MPTSRAPHDPFTTTSNNATSSSARTNASAASTRTRQHLFAPALSRRPTGRTTPRVDDNVLPDSDSDQENATAQRQRQQLRRIRHGSPEGRHVNRLKSKQQPQQQAEEPDIVNRQPDGTYLLGGSAMGVLAAPTVFGQDLAEAADNVDAAIARKYFASGAHLSTRSSRHAEDEFERERPEIQLRLREQALARLEDAKWLYEPVDRFHSSGIP